MPAELSSSHNRGLTRLESLMLDLDDIGDVLTDLARLATEVVTVPASCGITLRYDDGLTTVGSSDPRAEQLDESQYVGGDGPCLQSLTTGEIVDVPDTRTEVRWPPYTAGAVSSGQRCSLSVPLRVGTGSAFGAMNVYGYEAPHAFGPRELRQLEIFAAQASGTLRVATQQVKDVTVLSQMEEALHSRAVIDQALGIIMASQRCSARRAFDLLRSRSQNSHLRLRVVAANLIEEITGEPAAPGRPFEAASDAQ